MTIPTSSLERSLRRQVQQRLFASPVLWSEFQTVQRARRPSAWKVLATLGSWIFYLQLLFQLPLLGLAVLLHSVGPEGPLAAQAYASACVACALAAYVAPRLRSSRDLSVHSHLPTADRDVLWKIWTDSLWRSLLALYFSLLVYGFLAFKQGFTWQAGQVTLLMSLGQWVLCVLTASCLVALFPRWPALPGIGLFAFPVAVSAFVAPDLHAEICRATLLIFPAGWFNLVLDWGVWQGQRSAYWAALPVLMWCVFCCVMIIRFVNRFQIREFRLQPGQEVEARLENRQRSHSQNVLSDAIPVPPIEAEVAIAGRHPPTAADIIRRIRAREFLQPQDWSKLGPIERLVSRWLSPRERAIIEFLTTEQIRWSEMLWTSFLTAPLLVLPLLEFVIKPALALDFAAWMGVMFVGIFSAVLVFLTPLPPFRIRSCGGTYATQLAFFPLGFDEICLALSKVAIVRAVASLTIIVPYFLWQTLGTAFWPWEAVLSSIQLVLQLMLLSSWHCVWLFSRGIAFPHVGWNNISWHAACLLVTGLGIAGGLAVTYSITIGFAAGAAAPIIGFVVLMLASLSVWGLFRAAYQDGVIDLVQFTQSDFDKNMEALEREQFQWRRIAEARPKRGWFGWLKPTRPQTETK